MRFVLTLILLILPPVALAHTGLHSHPHEHDAAFSLLALEQLGPLLGVVLLLGIVLAAGFYLYRRRATQAGPSVRQETALGATDSTNEAALYIHHTRLGGPYG